MRHIFIFFVSFLLIFSASAQAVYRWKLSIGSGTLFYIGDVGNKKMSRPSGALHVSLERRFAYGIAARARGEFGHISANDRTNAFNKVNKANPNFDRNLNFRTRMANAYIELMYYTNNGYIFKEDAFASPFVFAGIGVSNFQVFADQFYGPANSQQYDYGNDNGDIRNVPTGDKKVQDGNFETNITKKPLEGKTQKNTVLALPIGAGVNLRFSERWNAQIAAAMSNPFTDYLDGVSGKYVAQSDPNLAYLSNPSNKAIGTDRGNKSKKDNVISTSFTVNYNFGGNYFDKGPVVYADSVRKNTRKEEVFVIDPFDEKMATTPVKSYVLKEHEEWVMFTNTYGRRDTMVVMRMDTLYNNVTANTGAANEYLVPRGGSRQAAAQSPKSAYSAINYGTVKPAIEPKATEDIYNRMNELDKKLAESEKKSSALPAKNTTGSGGMKSDNAYASTSNDIAASNVNNFQKVSIAFDLNGAGLDENDLAKLNAVADILKKYQNMGVAINSYSDLVGVISTNYKLAQERATNIRAYLTSLGIKPEQMIAQYHGSDERPNQLDATKRRADIEFIRVR